MNRLLAVPKLAPVLFEQNFVKKAVCELRYPVLLQLDASSVSAGYKVLRKEYPNFERGNRVSIGPGAMSVEGEPVFSFKSRDKHWQLSIKSAAMSIDTDSYGQFEELAGRVRKAVDAFKDVLQTDFFTRVGLRYVNGVLVRDEQIAEDINPALLAPLADGSYGTVNKYVQEVRGDVEEGSYTFRHGFADRATDGVPEYFLDFDFHAEDVEFAEVLPRLRAFSGHAFSFFMWALGPRAKASLKPSVK